MKTIRIGFIGAGLSAHGHALALRYLIEGDTIKGARLELAKVYDCDHRKASVLAEQHGFTETAADPEALIGDPSVNTVYICTPTVHHKKYFLAAAAAGKHIFVEKPIAFSTSEIREMLYAQKKAGIQAQVGLVLRYEPVFRYLEELLEREKDNFGSLLSFYLRSDQEWPLCGSFHDSEWRANPSDAFAGCLFEHSIHDVDLLRRLFGEVSVLSAYVGYRSPSAGKRIEDAVTVNFSLAGGGSGTLNSMYHRIKGRDVRRLEIFYERAAIILDDYTAGGFDHRYRDFTIEVSGRQPKQIRQAEVDQAYYRQIGEPNLLYPALVSAYRYQALAFLRSLLERRKAAPGLETGLKAHLLIESVYAYARREQSLKKMPV